MEKELGEAVDKTRMSDDSFTGNKETYKRGQNPNSLANLKPYPKGVSGNPDGRPKKYVKLAKALDKVGQKTTSWNEPNQTFKEAVLDKIWRQAFMYGSVPHIKMLAELGCLDGDE